MWPFWIRGPSALLAPGPAANPPKGERTLGEPPLACFPRRLPLSPSILGASAISSTMVSNGCRLWRL